MANGKSKFADHTALFNHAPAGSPVGYGFMVFRFRFNFYPSYLLHLRDMWPLFFSYVLGLAFFLDGPYIISHAIPPTQHTNPLSVLSADPSQSLPVPPLCRLVSRSYITSAVTYIPVV